MQEVLERRKRQQMKRVEIAKQFVQRLRAEIGPITAWVYGSVAKGTFKSWSDIDVFVVAENLPSHPLKRFEVLYRFVEGDVEPKAWTLSEFLSRLERGDKQLLMMLSHRILLVDELDLESFLQTKISDASIGVKCDENARKGGIG